MNTNKTAKTKAEKLELIKGFRNAYKTNQMSEATATAAEPKMDSSENIQFPKDLNLLAEEFSKATEQKAAKTSTIEFFPDEEKRPTLEPEPQPEPEPENSNLKTDNSDLTSNLLSAETTADLFVGGLDVIQQQVFKFIIQAKVKKKIGKKADKLEIEGLVDEVDQGIKQILEIDIEKRSLIRLMQRANAQIEALELSDDEYNDLATTLTAIIKDHPGYQLPPHYGLALAAAKIFIPRLIDTLSA